MRLRRVSPSTGTLARQLGAIAPETPGRIDTYRVDLGEEKERPVRSGRHRKAEEPQQKADAFDTQWQESHSRGEGKSDHGRTEYSAPTKGEALSLFVPRRRRK